MAVAEHQRHPGTITAHSNNCYDVSPGQSFAMVIFHRVFLLLASFSLGRCFLNK